MKEQWMVYTKKADFAGIAERFGISPVTARIMRNRDVEGDEAVRLFLHGKLEDCHDPELLKDMEKAILASDIGITPQNDGKVIRLTFPPLTEDRRKEIVKDVQKIAEETKVQVRNVRRDTLDKLKAMKKSGELTEDDLKQGEKKTQDLTDKHIKKVDKISADKQKELLEL